MKDHLAVVDYAKCTGCGTLFWWRHSCKDGQYSSAKVHRSVKVALRDAGTIPTSADDYVISLEALPGLEPEVIDGI